MRDWMVLRAAFDGTCRMVSKPLTRVLRGVFGALTGIAAIAHTAVLLGSPPRIVDLIADDASRRYR